VLGWAGVQEHARAYIVVTLTGVELSCNVR
jgi:hypothetical protein